MGPINYRAELRRIEGQLNTLEHQDHISDESFSSITKMFGTILPQLHNVALDVSDLRQITSIGFRMEKLQQKTASAKANKEYQKIRQEIKRINV